jgi:hypothetical protein
MLLGGLEAYSQVYAPNVRGLGDAWPFILLLVVLSLRFVRGRGVYADNSMARA